MTVKIHQRRVSRAAGWARSTAFFALVLMLVGGFAHRTQVIETPPFLWVMAIVGTLAAASLAMAGWGFYRLWSRGDRGGRASTAAAFFALAVLSPFIVSAVRFAIYPPLSDISTDTALPPALATAAALRTPRMNAVEPVSPEAAALQATRYPFVAGRRYEYDRDLVSDLVATLFEQRGWSPATVHDDAADGAVTLEASARTFFFGFVDDVAVRIAESGGTTVVDMRSASRFGRHDFGANASRIRDFLSDLDRRIQGTETE